MYCTVTSVQRVEVRRGKTLRIMGFDSKANGRLLERISRLRQNCRQHKQEENENENEMGVLYS